MLKAPTGMEVIRVISARDMYAAVMKHFDEAQVVIKSAAVSDYRPKQVAEQKMKKNDDDLVIHLERNPDILFELGQKKGDKVLVGFAAETNDLLQNARVKIQKKNLDFVVANDVTKEGAGFGTDTNIVKIINRDGFIEEIPKMSKKEIAKRVVDKVVTLL